MTEQKMWAVVRDYEAKAVSVYSCPDYAVAAAFALNEMGDGSAYTVKPCTVRIDDD